MYKKERVGEACEKACHREGRAQISCFYVGRLLALIEQREQQSTLLLKNEKCLL